MISDKPKKDMTQFDKPYNPQEVEPRWLQEWINRGSFHADTDAPRLNTFSMVIPPPNITGSLHLGHALNNTLQDILVRWKRMRGFSALWVPGTDHAGIATQNVVERKLLADGTNREELGREEFLRRVWKWREESGRTIVQQLKRLGASCDWARERFTMDEGLSSAVREVFVRLYEDGLIYRGERLINWCPRCETALSDIEVEHEEIQGKLYHIRYPLAEDPTSFLTVATTRPETMLGDTAVAVHPDDSRFNKLIGKKILLPLTNREIPIVGDFILVNREFGTGAVKITPGHDFNDEKAGQRHRLTKISLLNRKGKIKPLPKDVDSEVQGSILLLNSTEARKKIVDLLDQRGHLFETKDHRHAIGKCYRCKTVVEPFDSAQWFVKMNDPLNSLAAPAIEAVRSNRVRLIPEGWKNNYLNWMENIQDWCISRQIWWGHQLPVWYCLSCTDHTMVQTDSDGTPIIGKEAIPIVSRTPPAFCPECKSKNLVQDPDVLDTWFSSALWPFSTLGWPNKTPELECFYPTSTLVTSFDILFFWVARMIMMGLKFMGEIPFRDVYIHALVRDAEGQKMSKSKGNVIDPLHIMEEYGTDALRFTLASMASPGRDIKLAEDRIEGYRNFANKLWNTARFIRMNLPENYPLKKTARDEASELQLPLIHRWIISRLDGCTKAVNKALDAYRFDEAAREIYQFAWHEYCDWYLEMIKVDFSEESTAPKELVFDTLLTSFDRLLRLLHPFMPFITEEIRYNLMDEKGTTALSEYPMREKGAVMSAELDVEKGIIPIVSAVRNLRSELNIPPSIALKTSIKIADSGMLIRLQNEWSPYIKRLARLSSIEAGGNLKRPPKSIAASLPKGELYLSIEGVIDFKAEEARLNKRRAKLEKEKADLEKKLDNKNFIQKASPEAVARTKGQHESVQQQYQKVTGHLEQIQAMAGEG